MDMSQMPPPLPTAPPAVPFAPPLPPAVVSPPPVDPQEELAQLESRIKNGIEQFVDVGMALQAIRDRGLYRPKYQSFVAYVEDKWQLKYRRACQRIEVAKIGKILQREYPGVPLRESWVFELRKLHPSDAIEVFQVARAEHGAAVNARSIGDVRARLHPTEQDRKRSEKAKERAEKEAFQAQAAALRAAVAARSAQEVPPELDEQFTPLYRSLKEAQKILSDSGIQTYRSRSKSRCPEPSATHLRKAMRELAFTLSTIGSWVGIEVSVPRGEHSNADHIQP